ncbi:hypothetical protein M8J77_013054 [Diaphorina citri]|nr:hypothetical protein M8J77_013054 [Diaphorina citri]
MIGRFLADFGTQLVILACVGLSLVQGQRFQSAPRVVESDYESYDDVPQQRAQAPVVSRATGPSPSRNNLLSDNSVKSTTPVVAILKQINRHNEDGSYTYGYEGGDGSFKIETKSANGEVMGKYGYVDDSGKVRVIEYGANKYGFQPSGEGITVPPPNLVEEVTEVPSRRGQGQAADEPVEYDEQIVEKPRPRPLARAPAPKPSFSRQPQQQFASASFQSRDSLLQEEIDPQQNTAPVQFVNQDPSPPRPPPSFSAPPQSFSAPAPSFSSGSFSAFLTSDNAPPPRPAPARVPQFSNAAPAPPRPQSFANAAPVPPRPQSFAGASPVPPRPQSFAGASPVPPRPAAFAGASLVSPSEDSFQSQPQFRPRPAQAFFQPAPPSFGPPPRPVSRQSSSSILDQLAQDYALPQGGARPLHDITFGAQ